MITSSAEEFLSAIPSMHPIVGLDMGTKTIGVALSDRLWQIASADFVIKRSQFTKDAMALSEYLKRTEAASIVLGLPKNMDNSEGPRAQSTKSFAHNLEKFFSEKPKPILLWDERLSTVEAERAMIEADMSRQKRGEKIDAVAASLILQGALDRINVLRHD